MSNFHCALCGGSWIDRSSEGYTAGCRHTIQEATGPSISGMKAEIACLRRDLVAAEAENAALLALVRDFEREVSYRSRFSKDEKVAPLLVRARTILTEIDAALKGKK